MTPKTRSLLFRYGLAVVSVAVAAAIRVLLDPWLEDRFPFLTLFASIILIGRYGGLGPALLGIICTFLAAVLLLLHRNYSFDIQRTEYQIIVILFTLIGIGNAMLFDSVRKAQSRARAKQEQLQEESKRRSTLEAENRDILQLAHKLGKIGYWEWNSLTDENKWSPEIEALYGLPPGGFEGGYAGWAKLLHPDDLAKAEADVKLALETGEYFTEFRVVWPDGGIHWLETRATVFKDENNKPVRLIGVNMDVTDRKRVEDELRQSQQELHRRIEQLAEGDRRKDEFLAMLAHELRNPLAPIRNAVQILRFKSPVEPELQAARDMIDRQVQQMIRLVDDLLDLARITRNKLQLRKQQIDLEAVLQNAVETARPLIETSNHELTVTLLPRPIYLDADPVRLAQVFANLLTNAAKYSEHGGHIWLTVQVQGSDAVVSVRDTGVGIPKEMLTRVWEIFTQVDQSLERSQGGLGIGLTLVRNLVEMHGGSVEARSEGDGKGSEFIVRLPILIGCNPPDSIAPDDESHTIAKCRIVVADDNIDAADSLAILLRIMGNEVCCVYDGLAAVEAAEAYRPDAVLLDIGMPKLNGYEAARRIREQPWGKHIVLLALTGWGQEDDKLQSKEAGFNYHMVKPVDPAAVGKLLTSLIPSSS